MLQVGDFMVIVMRKDSLPGSESRSRKCSKGTLVEVDQLIRVFGCLADCKSFLSNMAQRARQWLVSDAQTDTSLSRILQSLVETNVACVFDNLYQI